MVENDEEELKKMLTVICCSLCRFSEKTIKFLLQHIVVLIVRLLLRVLKAYNFQFADALLTIYHYL